MRLNLDADPAAFVKQLANVRRDLNAADCMDSPLMTAAFVPFAAALRAELKQDGIDPREVMDGVSYLLANVALTTVQSLMNAPALVEAETVEKALVKACHIGCRAIQKREELLQAAGKDR